MPAGGDSRIAAGTQLHERLGAVVERVLGRPVRVDEAAVLPGVSHRSYRLATDRGAFAVKLREPGAAHLLALADEHDVHARVARAGLAPVPVGFDVAAGALVTRFVDGAVALSPDRTREPAMIERLAALLAALHGVPAAGVAPFTAEAHARRYVDAVRRAGDLDAEEEALAAELVELGAELDGLDAERVLCHADLVASNVLESDRLWLIDFEYAAAADPVLDLASLAAMNAFDSGQCRVLLEAYASLSRRPWGAAEFDKVVRLLRLLGHFWAEAEAGRRAGPRGELEAFRVHVADSAGGKEDGK